MVQGKMLLCSFFLLGLIFNMDRAQQTGNGMSTAATGRQRSDDYIIHEKRNHLPNNWSKGDKLASDFVLPMRIALAQQNLDAVDKLLMDVSDPQSTNYGRHMTASQVADTFVPRQETVAAVMGWLQQYDIDLTHVRTSLSKGWLYFNLTVAKAEQLLKTKYYVYKHSSGKHHPATEEYSVPAVIKQHIDFITPTLHFDVPVNRNSDKSNGLKKKRSSNDVKSVGTGLAPNANSGQGGGLLTCNETTTLACLRILYNFANSEQKSNKWNNYGIVEYTPQSYIQSDLDLFLGRYNPPAKGTTPIIHFIDDTVLDTADPGNIDIHGESNLDLQYAIGLVYPTPVTLYQTGDLSGRSSFNTFLDGIDGFYCTFEGGDDPYVDPMYPDPENFTGAYKGPENCGKYRATNVISTSYAYNEADLTPAYEQRQCIEYAKLGLQGVTVLFSSGDYGVAGNGGYCIDLQSEQYTTGPAGITFNPTFPGTCPYITSVGGTQVNPNSTVYDPESAWHQQPYSSSGGFSNVFRLPFYQQAAVKSFFALHKPSYNSTQYNNSGITRGYPDISANAANYIIAVGGSFYLVGGTSASSPVVGSIITLINDARLAVGKRPVGFLNSVLYANPYALNDITSGNNPGCGTNGFSAVKGWDPVTGLGTPDFQKLKNLFLSLP